LGKTYQAERFKLNIWWHRVSYATQEINSAQKKCTLYRFPSANSGSNCVVDNTRKPKLLFLLFGLLLFRLETRQLLLLLFQEPPRRTLFYESIPILKMTPLKKSSSQNTSTNLELILDCKPNVLAFFA